MTPGRHENAIVVGDELVSWWMTVRRLDFGGANGAAVRPSGPHECQCFDVFCVDSLIFYFVAVMTSTLGAGSYDDGGMIRIQVQ